MASEPGTPDILAVAHRDRLQLKPSDTVIVNVPRNSLHTQHSSLETQVEHIRDAVSERVEHNPIVVRLRPPGFAPSTNYYTWICRDLTTTANAAARPKIWPGSSLPWFKPHVLHVHANIEVEADNGK